MLIAKLPCTCTCVLANAHERISSEGCFVYWTVPKLKSWECCTDDVYNVCTLHTSSPSCTAAITAGSLMVCFSFTLSFSLSPSSIQVFSPSLSEWYPLFLLILLPFFLFTCLVKRSPSQSSLLPSFIFSLTLSHTVWLFCTYLDSLICLLYPWVTVCSLISSKHACICHEPPLPPFLLSLAPSQYSLLLSSPRFHCFCSLFHIWGNMIDICLLCPSIRDLVPHSLYPAPLSSVKRMPADTAQLCQYFMLQLLEPSSPSHTLNISCSILSLRKSSNYFSYLNSGGAE